jgi:glycolate oxidase FAD binding subunit
MHATRVEALIRQVAAARAAGHGIRIRGADTRGVSWPEAGARSGAAGSAEVTVLDTSPLSGVLDWQAEELVVSVAAGTRLLELEATLAEGRQRLLGEPWLPAAGSTVGGAVAMGLSGPGRPWLGSVSDGVLGVRLLTAPGGRLVDGRFGGRVIKNVAGFDVSRLQVGACGVFGLLLELNLRVAPIPADQRCLAATLGPEEGLQRMLGLEPPAWPVSGAALAGERLHLRLEGEPSVVEAAVTALGPDFDEESPVFWQDLRAGRLPCPPAAGPHAPARPGRPDPLSQSEPAPEPRAEPVRLWRVAVPRGTPPLALPGTWVIDWGGALQWWRTPDGLPVDAVPVAARAVGGRVLPAVGAPFDWLPEAELRLHQALARELDPDASFNRGLLPGAGAVGGCR